MKARGWELALLLGPLVITVALTLALTIPGETGLDIVAAFFMVLMLPGIVALVTQVRIDRSNRNPPIEALRSRILDQVAGVLASTLIAFLCANRLWDWRLDEVPVVICLLLILSLVNVPGMNWLVLMLRLRTGSHMNRRYDRSGGQPRKDRGES